TVEYGRLLRYPRLQLLRCQSPLGVGPPPPCAGTGARRIDQNKVELSLKLFQLGQLAYHLHVAATGTLDPVMDRLQPLPVGVKGEHLSLVLHAGGAGKRLSTRPGTKIQNLHARGSTR